MCFVTRLTQMIWTGINKPIGSTEWFTIDGDLYPDLVGSVHAVPKCLYVDTTNGYTLHEDGCGTSRGYVCEQMDVTAGEQRVQNKFNKGSVSYYRV